MENLLSKYGLLSTKTTKITVTSDVHVKLVYFLGDLKAINFRKYFRKKKKKVFCAFHLESNLSSHKS